MVLESLSLKNFRSHKNTQLRFSDKLNFIVGSNGEGKTTILEAISYLCTTKNFSSSADNEVVMFDKLNFEIDGIMKGHVRNNVRVYYSTEENKKYYFLDKKQINRAPQVIGMFPVVLITQADYAITQGYPSERRKFIDFVVSQSSETYLQTLLDYNKTLKQRAALLSVIKETKNYSLSNELDAWNERLVNLGTEIIKYRTTFIEGFNEYLSDSYQTIMEGTEIPRIIYMFFDGIETKSIEKRFYELLAEKKHEEMRRGVNLVGPHRDDFVFEINNLNLKKYGSQGQHKTFQVAIKFAQFFYLKKRTGKTPVFLLDDVFGELDSNRSSKISNHLKDVGQAFITLTDFNNVKELHKHEDDLLIHVKKGTTEYVS